MKNIIVVIVAFVVTGILFAQTRISETEKERAKSRSFGELTNLTIDEDFSLCVTKSSGKECPFYIDGELAHVFVTADDGAARNIVFNNLDTGYGVTEGSRFGIGSSEDFFIINTETGKSVHIWAENGASKIILSPSGPTITGKITGSGSANLGLDLETGQNVNLGTSDGWRVAEFYAPTSVSADKPGIILGYDDTKNTGIVGARTQSAGSGIDFYTYNGTWSAKAELSVNGDFSVLRGFTADNFNYGNVSPARNYIRNGNMQRSTINGSWSTLNDVSGGQQVVNGWDVGGATDTPDASYLTTSQPSGVDDSKSIRLTFDGTAGPNKYIFFRQVLNSWQDLSGKTVTVSAWVKTNNSDMDLIRWHGWDSSFSDLGHTGGGAWEFLTVTKTLPATGSGNGQFTIGMHNDTAAPGDFIEITNVTLNIGDQAAPYQTNLALVPDIADEPGYYRAHDDGDCGGGNICSGTWTPTLVFTSGGTVTYTSQAGTWMRVGNTITAQFTLVVNTVSGISGSTRIQGFVTGMAVEHIQNKG